MSIARVELVLVLIWLSEDRGKKENEMRLGRKIFFLKKFFNNFILRYFLLILALFTIIKFTQANLSLQCIVSYLKSHNAYEDVFSSVDEFIGTEAECESFIRIKIDDFNEKVLEKMEEDSNVKNLIDCFKHEIQSHEYEILTLKLQGVGGCFNLC